MEEVNLASESLLTSLHWMLRQTCIKKKKNGSPINVVTLVIAKPLFPTERRR